MNIRNLFNKAYSYFQEQERRMEAKRVELQRNAEIPSYSNCKNCHTELQGMYCHRCGQYAYKTTPKMWTFIKEYVNNIYPWDSRIVPTLLNLIWRPGYLTNEFIAGKYNSYVHPLKLNIFFLFIVATIFLLFSDNSISNNSLNNIFRNDTIAPHLSLSVLSNNEEYSRKMQESELDTIRLAAPLSLTQTYPHIIANTETLFKAETEKQIDTFMAAIPEVLIKDSVIIADGDRGYKFSSDNKFVYGKEVDIINRAWVKMVDIIMEYLPIIILLTSPIMAFAIRVMHPRDKRNRIYHFVFALHYTAFVELLFLTLLPFSLLDVFGTGHVERFATVVLWLYMTIAIRRVYHNKSWAWSFFKALMINAIYVLTALATIMSIFFATVSFFIVRQLLT